MQPVQATFATQEQAEAAVRKLASLRGDRFRLERSGAAAPSASVEFASSLGEMVPAYPSEEGVTASALASDAMWSDGAFMLSADIPAEAAEQARRVIQDAGGSLA
jgi:hypothetical protein